MKEIITIRNYRELKKSSSFRSHLRSTIRDAAIFVLSAHKKIDSSKEWIRFICYHHVFDDERKDFRRQLKYFKNYGDFISLDIAVNIFEDNKRIDGRYFCVTFDDGYKNCVANAFDILIENKCPAAFFIITDYIGCGIAREETIEFLNWNDCRKLIEAGMIIGSHTASHTAFSKLNEDRKRSELSRSKQRIEKELGIVCKHFACPWGKPGRDFKVPNDMILAKEAGYQSFFTSERGPNYSRTDPFGIRRDHIIAKWGNYQLRYFFSK